MYFKDFSSGAMIENIVRRAKKLAIKRHIAGGERGHPHRRPPRVDRAGVQGARGPAQHDQPRRLGEDLGQEGRAHRLRAHAHRQGRGRGSRRSRDRTGGHRSVPLTSRERCSEAARACRLAALLSSRSPSRVGRRGRSSSTARTSCGSRANDEHRRVRCTARCACCLRSPRTCRSACPSPVHTSADWFVYEKIPGRGVRRRRRRRRRPRDDRRAAHVPGRRRRCAAPSAAHAIERSASTTRVGVRGVHRRPAFDAARRRGAPGARPGPREPIGDDASVLIHNDLGPEHVLVDDSRSPVGIIDFEDAHRRRPERAIGCRSSC